ncbi:MAG: hypothetical protein WAK39_06800, partial [Pseudolabrys sp.]
MVDKARQLIAAPELIGPAHTIRVHFNGNLARIIKRKRTDSFSSAQPQLKILLRERRTWLSGINSK